MRVLASVALTAVAALALGACASVTSGTATLVKAPDAKLQITGGTGQGFDVEAANAISDVIAFWTKAYPSVSNGQALPALKGGLFSVDGASVVRTKKAPADVAHEGCLQHDPTFIVDNAAYCEVDDSIIWDRSQQHLIPVLAAHYGPTLVAMVFAHEFGHAIQDRLRIGGDQPTIDIESQADCAAGAFIASALKGDAPHFRISAAQLDEALDGYLQIRDSTPESPDDISHGDGFDRLSAVDAGIQGGVSTCYAPNWYDRKFTERPFSTDQDLQSGGNQPLADVLSTSGGLTADLQRFWTSAGTSVGKSFQKVTLTQAAHPPCEPSAQFAYCPDDNTVYYSSGFAKDAYYSLTAIAVSQRTGAVSLVHDQPADYALGFVASAGWGMAARHQFFGGSTDDRAALLAAVCYGGAYAANINHDPTSSTPQFLLSPPDMDEATSAVLNLVSSPAVFGQRDTTGLQRIRSFVTGYQGGLSAC